MYLFIDLDVVALPCCSVPDDFILACGVIFDIKDIWQGGVVQDDLGREVLQRNGVESAISPRGNQSKEIWGCS